MPRAKQTHCPLSHELRHRVTDGRPFTGRQRPLILVKKNPLFRYTRAFGIAFKEISCCCAVSRHAWHHSFLWTRAFLHGFFSISLAPFSMSELALFRRPSFTSAVRALFDVFPQVPKRGFLIELLSRFRWCLAVRMAALQSWGLAP